MGKRSRDRVKRTLAAARAAKRGEGKDASEGRDEEVQNEVEEDTETSKTTTQSKSTKTKAETKSNADSELSAEEDNGREEEQEIEGSSSAGEEEEEEEEEERPRKMPRVNDAKSKASAKNDPEDVIAKGMAWLRDEEAVKKHIEGFDLIEILNSSGGLSRIENFLPPEAAEAALHILQSLPESRWSIRRDDNDAKRNATAHRFYVAGVKNKDDPLFFLHRAVQGLLPEKKITLSAGRYSDGDHIAPHDDLGYHHEDGKKWSRDVAVILYLTKDWQKRDGGILLDMEQNSKQYVPKFNSLISFAVPRKHAVTAVKPRKDRLPRYSLFGWFLVEGDLYKFKPEPLVEVRKPKRQKIQRKRKERR